MNCLKCGVELNESNWKLRKQKDGTEVPRSCCKQCSYGSKMKPEYPAADEESFVAPSVILTTRLICGIANNQKRRLLARCGRREGVSIKVGVQTVLGNVQNKATGRWSLTKDGQLRLRPFQRLKMISPGMPGWKELYEEQKRLEKESAT